MPTTPTAAPAPTTFKRLPLQARFTHKGQSYRKATQRGAFHLLASGRGQTHAQVPFSRSAAVEQLLS